MASFYLAKAGETPGCHPLTLTRTLGEFPLAGTSLRQHQLAALLALGQVESDGPDADLTVHPAAWFAPAELATFNADSSYATLTAADGCVILTRKGGVRDLRATQSFAIAYAWDLLRANAEAMTARKSYVQESGAHPSLYVEGRLQVGKGTKILPGVVIEGDVIIGDNCKIGPNCYLRGSTAISDKCHVGFAVWNQRGTPFVSRRYNLGRESELRSWYHYFQSSSRRRSASQSGRRSHGRHRPT